MIKVDISNIWGQITLADLLSLEQEVFAAHCTLSQGDGAGGQLRGWLELPVREPTAEMLRIQKAAKKIRRESQVCVVVGVGGSSLGARAAIELLQGADRNFGKGKGDPLMLFAGNSLSSRQYNALLHMLEGKDFSVIIISKSGGTMEPAIAFRGLRWILERKYGTSGANSRIYAVTDPVNGALRQMAEQSGWESFVIPRNVGGRYSVLTPVGLLPMAVAGIDIAEVMRGAAEAKEAYNIRSFENPVWLYASVRNLMYRKGKCIEVFSSFEPGFRQFGRWWQKLFSESEGKEGKGIFPVPAELTADLHVLGQMLQQGERNLFETMIRFDPPEEEAVIMGDARNQDGLSYLSYKTMAQVEEMAFQGTVEAHVDGGVPVITMDCGRLDARLVGELFCFLELSCAVSAYILGVNPFNQPGVERYRHNMFRLLGRPGYEN